MKPLPRALFISHGGGPLPLLGDPGHGQMVSCLQDIASNIPRPEAVLVVSAHWEEPVPAITAGSTPPLIYDYYGFPPESYEIAYPCAGEPSLAREVYRLLGEGDIEARLDEARGFDHGVFVPLKIMYPQADIPCVQLSLADSLDPAFHIQVGSALQSLASRNVLVIGSGFSFHNMEAFFAPENAESDRLNKAFEVWLQNVCEDPELPEFKRHEQLIHWEEAPGARFCHPREEHLLPLHVCYGIAQAPSTERYELSILNKQSSMYLW
ncbi:DODA-type extradiol aromatic ring-opening family dioxygenase [Thiohalophilus thiocyanatoxydans]|uniref:Aromatic ring-opening dioxygenase catalytic subunit (LigB family) n=1 Tax=Thiohalophilus thiocyanatoxydans TaxID=381308 RepID=A0A4R8IQ37_9GAMM|nr:class III extradiol ring-cleavage dioxygenase [Thiohalophilus thiocyanatoxydans]TDY02384.1 aromatic ring-opening dioxygenase catalytic subunit (LigB family) [Thiohalophilus thiocyanatoxydans]